MSRPSCPHCGAPLVAFDGDTAVPISDGFIKLTAVRGGTDRVVYMKSEPMTPEITALVDSFAKKENSDDPATPDTP
jgi:uncharacterized Zn finger protein (UPF0148 family)